MILQPKLPDYLNTLPAGYTYLGLGPISNINPNGIPGYYHGYAANLDCGWISGIIKGFSTSLHYCVPNNSEILKIKGFTANMIKDMPSELPALPVDYVYLGKGMSFIVIGSFIGLGLVTRTNWYNGRWSGTCDFTHYAAHKDSEIVKLNSKTTMKLCDELKKLKSDFEQEKQKKIEEELNRAKLQGLADSLILKLPQKLIEAAKEGKSELLVLNHGFEGFDGFRQVETEDKDSHLEFLSSNLIFSTVFKWLQDENITPVIKTSPASMDKRNWNLIATW